MIMLKNRNGSSKLSVSGIQKDAISDTINQNIDFVVDFDNVRATLPKIVSGSNSVVRVNNSVFGDFIACSEEGLISLIQEVVNKYQSEPSFFDGMESFETKEKVLMTTLNQLPPRASEYTKEDSEALSRLLRR